MRPRLCGLALLLIAAFANPAFADDEAFSWAGFGTLGITYNPSDDFSFVRDLLQSGGVEDGVSSKIDSNLGLQLEYRFLPELEGVVQVVSRHDQDGSFPPELTSAYLKYSPNPTWDVRGGRVGWDVFMLSDSRNVGYSYLWVRPPLEYFGLQQLSHIDGFDVVGTRPLGPGLFWFKLYGGFADEQLPLDSETDYDLSGTRILGGHANYQIGNWWLRLGYSHYKLDEALDELQPFLAFMRNSNQTAAELADDIQLKNATGHHLVAGLVYDRGPVQVQLMFDRSKSDTLLFHDFYAGYATVSYRVGRLTPYLSFARVESDEASRDSGFPPGSPIDQSVQALLENGRLDQHTTSFGIRYDLFQNAALKLQVDQLWAKEPTTTLMRDPDPDWDGRGTIVSATLDFVF